jgi:tetratricopeptide (TPR) repeat protein
MLVPVCHAIYEYQGKSYHMWASGTNASRLVADNLPVDDKRKQSINLGFFPFFISIITAAYAVFGLHYNWVFPVAVVLAFLLYGFLRKSAILRHSRQVRQWLLANKRAAESNTAAMTAAQQSDVAKSMERPQRPWLSHTSRDQIVVPLVVLLAAALPFSQYVVSTDTSQTQYTTQQASPTTSSVTAPVSVPVTPVEQNNSTSSSTENGQVPDLPAASEQTNDSTTADNTESPVQRNPQQARKLNTEGLRALAGPQPNLVAAKGLFQKAVQFDPDYIEALNNLGDVYGRLEDYRSAEQILAKVLAIAPNRRVAHGNMGYVKAKLGKTDEASVQFCEYVRLFQSFENGEARLRGSFGDPDPQVQNAVALTLSNCRP